MSSTRILRPADNSFIFAPASAPVIVFGTEVTGADFSEIFSVIFSPPHQQIKKRRNE